MIVIIKFSCRPNTKNSTIMNETINLSLLAIMLGTVQL